MRSTFDLSRLHSFRLNNPGEPHCRRGLGVRAFQGPMGLLPETAYHSLTGGKRFVLKNSPTQQKPAGYPLAVSGSRVLPPPGDGRSAHPYLFSRTRSGRLSLQENDERLQDMEPKMVCPEKRIPILYVSGDILFPIRFPYLKTPEWLEQLSPCVTFRKRDGDPKDVTVVERDLRLCTVREVLDGERRFCFEVSTVCRLFSKVIILRIEKNGVSFSISDWGNFRSQVLSPQKSHVLQADSEKAQKMWVDALKQGE